MPEADVAALMQKMLGQVLVEIEQTSGEQGVRRFADAPGAAAAARDVGAQGCPAASGQRSSDRCVGASEGSQAEGSRGGPTERLTALRSRSSDLAYLPTW